MLKSILKEPRLNNKAFLNIVLVPPPPKITAASVQSIQFPYEYLASHVIQVESSLTSRSKRNDKRTKEAAHRSNPEYQLLFTLNDRVIYKTNQGYIYHSSNNARAKIVHTEILYTNPENDVCTHLLLYLNHPLIILDDTSINTNVKSTKIQQFNEDLCFQEMMKRIFPDNDINGKIDKLVLKFCDTSVNCDSLKSLLDCMESVLNEGYNMIESSNLPPTSDLDVIFGSFESFLMESTYDVAFFKITQFLLPQDQKLSAVLEDIEYLDFSQIGLPASITDERVRVFSAISEFERIGSFRTPGEKLDCLLNTISQLTKEDTASTTTFLDSDSLIPLLLMTLIRSKVPHLTANLTYMKEYTFERNIKTGKYGYALSTFEGVLDYILESHLHLKALSQQNIEFWSAIESGDLDRVVCLKNSHDIRDVYGNSALMIACMADQPNIAEYFIDLLKNSNHSDVNDMKSTPLMLAIKHGKSLETVRLLMKSDDTTSNCVDNYGNTALLYACGIGDLDILKCTMEASDKINLNQHINTITGDTALHVAARKGCSLEFMRYLIDHSEKSLVEKINGKHQLFHHLCESYSIIKELLICHHHVEYILYAIDNKGRSPLMTWGYKGRVDLVEIVVAHFANNTAVDYSRVDEHGRNILHLIALHLSKGLTLGEKSLDYIVEKFKNLINVRDWVHGNTPLHIAAELSTLATSHQINHAAYFIRALLKYGAMVEASNFKDEWPINICRIDSLVSLLDQLRLKVDPSFAPVMKHSIYQYSWFVTRFCIEESTNDNNFEIYYIVKSGQIGNPDSMREVKRRFQDFLFLRSELLYEMPELFLPAFQQMKNPLDVDMKPPPLAWVNMTLNRFQSFMEWLQYHPVLRYHDLVISFVRSSAELQRSMIRDNSFSRRKLLLEKMSDLPLPNSVTSIKDEEYFLTYALEMMKPLKDGLLDFLLAGRKMIYSGQELKREMLTTAHYTADLSHSLPISPLTIETIQVCANITCDRSYVSPWPHLFQTGQMAYDIMNGILISLEKPFTLLEERNALRDNIEQQKETLRKTKNWQAIFSLTERKKGVDYDKDKVVQNMNELNHIDSQINQSHKMISDELAHFQGIHPKEMIKSIKCVSRAALALERHKLSVLEQTFSKWNCKSASGTASL